MPERYSKVHDYHLQRRFIIEDAWNISKELTKLVKSHEPQISRLSWLLICEDDLTIRVRSLRVKTFKLGLTCLPS